ncbi:hypothetical protein GOP47_0011800 [Adiantum capillus-veneris]|uniref:Uncharacterized protein n=1 Tax=Adiantum capillus-veneris TaxID=13818 RepID=A0A9D4UTX0_ADICA|nr:hypothetical protein GOP47_0011800 [Adiantum capillus-veneris]
MGLSPWAFSADLTQTLHRCRKERDLFTVLHLVSCIFEDGLDCHVSLANQLVSLLVEIGSICYAQQLFHRLCQDDYGSPTRQTTVALLSMCGKLRDLGKGQEIHANIDTMELLKGDVYVILDKTYVKKQFNSSNRCRQKDMS